MFEDLDLVCLTCGLRALESSLELILAHGYEAKGNQGNITECVCLAKALGNNKRWRDWLTSQISNGTTYI